MIETSDVSFSKKYKYYVYLLYSYKDGGFYIGFTEDLKVRLISHAKGKNSATKDRRPLKLLHYEYFINKADAKAREEFLKSGYGRKQLKQILKRTLSTFDTKSSILSLSKPPQRWNHID
ncbi:hypothetical protein A3F29_00095 [Candidatus Roizmanbacteria bacterium RIFCSPHIGHO2_12_FULL_33_9]|uniref:GIY-YIG domain-containing protein n=1 Tax=Candidatus Roizmanbacteria bacterium RIFCSPHIGHO2_12_FULL_33_9 TaxID=1802045 RepID=A0A1F7HFK2_9BACT|nr:MAG: hypothetical protein A3F29_00095 [Candidatus Roizmanbacteria bacterium RIFCSPHIGHO2_12_FULL_33_9]